MINFFHFYLLLCRYRGGQGRGAEVGGGGGGDVRVRSGLRVWFLYQNLCIIFVSNLCIHHRKRINGGTLYDKYIVLNDMSFINKNIF